MNAADVVRGLANNLPQAPAVDLPDDATTETKLLALEWTTGFNAGREACQEFLLGACGDLRGSERVAS